MNSNLAHVLLTRGVIRQGTVIDLYHNVRGLSCSCNATVMGSFVIVGARLRDHTWMVFDTLDHEQNPCQIQAEQIIKIDGMLVERIAISHNLTLTGGELARRSQRGRRKKSPDTRVVA
jgi:hypothetical protein